jgi:alpha/beta superfamily hydrolase
MRFNFRGIGASEGSSSLGIDEVADARGAVEEMRTRYDLPIAIAGWSFGGAVAVRAAIVTRGLAAVVGIAPAIEEKPGITAGLPPADEFPRSVPLLVVCGANDELVTPQDAARWTTAAGGRFLEMKGANHFFWAKYEALAAVVGDFLDGTV